MRGLAVVAVAALALLWPSAAQACYGRVPTERQAERATVRYLEREIGGQATVRWCSRRQWGFRCLGELREFEDFFVREEPGDLLEVAVGVKLRRGRIYVWNPALD